MLVLHYEGSDKFSRNLSLYGSNFFVRNGVSIFRLKIGRSNVSKNMDPYEPTSFRFNYYSVKLNRANWIILLLCLDVSLDRTCFSASFYYVFNSHCVVYSVLWRSHLYSFPKLLFFSSPVTALNLLRSHRMFVPPKSFLYSFFYFFKDFFAKNAAPRHYPQNEASFFGVFWCTLVQAKFQLFGTFLQLCLKNLLMWVEKAAAPLRRSPWERRKRRWRGRSLSSKNLSFWPVTTRSYKSLEQMKLAMSSEPLWPSTLMHA